MDEIINSSKNDIIYLSLGTNVKSSELPPENINLFFKSLGQLPYTILYKYEKTEVPKNLPKNFIVRSWFPQQDILGHPKVKLFITQGGIQSIEEAVVRMVPMLFVPFFGDQMANAEKCVALGIGEKIHMAEVNENQIKEGF